jgi:hypothetical protein
MMKKKEKMKRLMVAVGDVFSTFLLTATIAGFAGRWEVAAGSLVIGVIGIGILRANGKLKNFGKPNHKQA